MSVIPTEREAASPPHLEHPALLYRNLDDFLGTMVPFVRAGVEGRERVFVAARADNLLALRSEVGEQASSVTWADTNRWHPHPASRMRAFYEFVNGELEAGASRLRLVGEPVWPEGPPEFVREWQRYESALNAVLAPYPVTLLCLYDRSRLDDSILEGATITHPATHHAGADEPTPAFESPEDFLRRWNPDLSEPPAGAARLAGFEGLSAARRFLTEEALAAGMSDERAMDLVTAANEILTNALVHTGGDAGLWTWVEDGRFLCQIRDRGRGIDDPLAGWRPPPDVGGSGRGLWIARQLVDLLQIVPGPDGTAFRLHLERSPTPR